MPTECKQDHVTSVCETPSCRFSELESISRGIANGTAVFFLNHMLFKSDEIKKSYYMRDQEYFFLFQVIIKQYKKYAHLGNVN